MAEDSPREPACPLCGEKHVRSLPCAFDSILKCPSCSFIFANPEEVDSDSVAYELEFAERAPNPTFESAGGDFAIRNRRKFLKILDRLERFRSTGRMLDVGCSAAFFLKLAAERGWDPQGVDVSEFGVSYSREKLGIPVFHGTLEEAAFPPGSFDVAFSSHTMEHIGQPLPVLREMARVLRPGGALVTLIPTQFASPAYRFFDVLFGDPPPRHVSFFTRRTYEAFLEKAGLRTVYSQHNVELDLLKRLVRARLRRAAHGQAPAPPAKAPPSSETREHGYGMGVTLLKSVINAPCTKAGIGDELFSVAVKP